MDVFLVKDGERLLLLEDTAGRPISVSLFQAAGAGRLWHADLSVFVDQHWLSLDLVALEEIEEGGMYLDGDGSLSLAHMKIVNDEKVWGDYSNIDAQAIARILAYARERLGVKPYVRERQSGLAERATVASV